MSIIYTRSTQINHVIIISKIIDVLYFNNSEITNSNFF